MVFKSWNTNVKLVFLNLVIDRMVDFNESLYAFLRDNLNLHSSYNSEVKNLWYQLSLNSKHSDVIPFVEEFLGKIGRMKYIRPIYKAYGLLNKKAAVSCFEKNRQTFFYICFVLIKKIFFFKRIKILWLIVFFIFTVFILILKLILF